MVTKKEYLKMKKELERKDEDIEILKRATSGFAWQKMIVSHTQIIIKDCLAQGHRLTYILEAIKMPQSTHYYWRYHVTINREKANINLKRKNVTIWYQRYHIYGYLMIHAFLKESVFM